jgi:hypothetical protein
VALLFELTGKTSGAEDSQVTVFVRSLTYGTVENVPTARKFPVSCKLPTVITGGMIVSESRGSGAAVRETVTAAVFDTTVPSGFFKSAVTVALPELTPVTCPLELTETIEGLLELQAICEELVTFVTSPLLPSVPNAINCPVWPEAETV